MYSVGWRDNQADNVFTSHFGFTKTEHGFGGLVPFNDAALGGNNHQSGRRIVKEAEIAILGLWERLLAMTRIEKDPYRRHKYKGQKNRQHRNKQGVKIFGVKR